MVDVVEISEDLRKPKNARRNMASSVLTTCLEWYPFFGGERCIW